MVVNGLKDYAFISWQKKIPNIRVERQNFPGGRGLGVISRFLTIFQLIILCKISKFLLISWCGNFVGTQFPKCLRRVALSSADTVCFHKISEIRWNHCILCCYTYPKCEDGWKLRIFIKYFSKLYERSQVTAYKNYSRLYQHSYKNISKFIFFSFKFKCFFSWQCIIIILSIFDLSWLCFHISRC